jgi:HAD superfamily phosphoserine phosphatase-like hydrolase
MTIRFRTLVLDVDSTVAGIEGIDWLARRRGESVKQRIASLTDDAMRGVIPLESVYGARLEAIQPTRQDVAALSEAYVAALTPGCIDVVGRLHTAGVHVVLISGGLRPAILPLARTLGVADGDLHAVGIWFAADGSYGGFDESSPLTTTNGKPQILRRLNVAKPIVAVGDGNTDLAMKPEVDLFVAYTGFIRREPVVAGADAVAQDFREVEKLVVA